MMILRAETAVDSEAPGCPPSRMLSRTAFSGTDSRDRRMGVKGTVGIKDYINTLPRHARGSAAGQRGL